MLLLYGVQRSIPYDDRRSVFGGGGLTYRGMVNFGIWELEEATAGDGNSVIMAGMVMGFRHSKTLRVCRGCKI